jgi:hypothetical protein
MAKKRSRLHTPIKHHHAAVALLSAVLLFTVALRAGVGDAAGVRYKFTARGVITQFDEANKTIKVDVTKAPGKAFDDLEGQNKEFTVGSAKVYSLLNGKDKRVTYHNLAVGQEIGFKGSAKDDDKYDLSFIRIHDRSFSVVGLLKEHTTATRTIKVLVQSSTYKNSTYKGEEVTMTYPEDATFYEKKVGTEVSFSDVTADDQKVRVTGKITSSSSWEVKNLFNNYKGTK